MTEAPPQCDLVVLGAGPAGLAVAWYAVRRGFSVVVVDRAAEVGGLATSLTVDGQSVDVGSHRLHPSIRPDILADLQKLPGLDLQWRTRNGRIRLCGRWLAFPLRPADLVRHAPPAFVAGVVRDLARSALRRRADAAVAPDSFGAQVRRHLGPTVARAFYEPYARKLWAVDADGLSAELFRRRVSAGSASGILRRVLRRGNPSGFWYPAGGFGQICARLAVAVVEGGGVLLTGTRIASMETRTDQPVVHLADGRAIVARTVVSTIPSAGLAELVEVPPEVSAAARELPFRGALLVYLTVPRDRYTAFDAHYFPELTTVISRLSEPKNYRTSAADPAGRTVLCAEVPATVGDELWRSDDESLVRRVARELAEQGLPPVNPISGRVERRSHVYPIYRLGFQEPRRVVDDCDWGPNVAVLGRQALFVHDNTHHGLLMAKTLVEALSDDARLDRDRWAATRRSFADHVVED